MSNSTTIVWFRRDFRLDDNPALRHAIDRDDKIVPVYIHSPHEEAPWEPGEASNWWLHNSLQSLSKTLENIGSRLIIRKGNSLEELRKLIQETKAETLYYNRLYEPAIIERDKVIKSSIKDDGIDVRSYNSALLNEPWEIEKRTGGPFKVFTPYWRHTTNTTTPRDPYPRPRKISSPKSWPKSLKIEDLKLFPKLDWWKGLDEAWEVGEDAAANRLELFLEEIAKGYGDSRNRPDQDGTSRMSPHLHFGEISPQRIWQKAHDIFGDGGNVPQGVWKFLAEIGWREFAHHLLYHYPDMTKEPINDRFKNFPWEEDEEGLRNWQKGQTGFPIVDAGMRQLYETGWMHNRVRMIVGSFLVKDLRVHWLAGARWFWDTLIDASLASNTMGWQWVAGCGADAAPYFRVFNPMTQGEKFDPKGLYTRKYCPELATMPDKYLQQPWEASNGVLIQSKIKLGKDYPEPLVDHAAERKKALAAYDVIKASKD